MSASPAPTQDRLARFALGVGRWIPDAMSTAVVMLVILALAAIATGNSPATTMDAFYRGLWMMVPFTMQMTLILVLSSTLGAAPVFRRTVAKVSRIPRTRAGVVTLACLVVAGLGYLFWGLAIALGPLIAIYFAREAERKQIAIDFPFLIATVSAAGALWQFGLSSTATLMMNTPGHFLVERTGILPFASTIWAPATLAFVVLWLLVVIVAGQLLAPRRTEPVSFFPDAYKQAEPLAVPGAEPASAHVEGDPTIGERLERSSTPALVLIIFLAAWTMQHFYMKGLGLDLNSLNTILLMLTLMAHGTVGNFQRALQGAVVSAWPIIVMYHLYGAVAGLLQYTTLGATLSGAFAAISTTLTFPLFTAMASTVVGLFVPSSGGLWVIQGLVTTEAAQQVGVSVPRALLSAEVGDQIGNLVTPFWAAIGAGMARIDFRRFIGYQFAYAAIWFVLGVIVFTFLPA